ncbi:hypothetical protein C6B37_00195 [Candidatus Phytoplasma phoenicium]|uniref:SAM-dependent methyltransferase n=1 Tax=Candidatus Phytoplasma phoenicium TaxID=198422 RepID=A0A2S8NVG4_9MOLU|nr:hypothetical protein C6B37_00195 [Candidatus Phytoplasma phoenicium]
MMCIEFILKKEILTKLKIFASQNHIPIINDETAIFLKKIIIKNNFQHILEIGTAIGYSALIMYNKNFIHTIEKDNALFSLAKSFLHPFESNIKVFLADALLYQPQQKYDLIFIDASKTKYIDFFQKYHYFLSFNGIIICDNVNFGNRNFRLLTRSKKRIIKRLNNFKEFLQKNQDFKTHFVNIGDGLSLTWRKDTSPPKAFF